MTIFGIYARRVMDRGRRARRAVKERLKELLEVSEDALNKKLLGHRYKSKFQQKKPG